jgi:hypothetical protein
MFGVPAIRINTVRKKWHKVVLLPPQGDNSPATINSVYLKAYFNISLSISSRAPCIP